MTMISSPLCSVEPQLAAGVFRFDTGVQLAGLPQKEKEFAQYFDGLRTVAQVCEVAQVSMTRGLATVVQLADRGCLTPVEPDSGFTSLEEAFFDSDVTPIDECDEPFETIGQKFLNFLFKIKTRIADSYRPAMSVGARSH